MTELDEEELPELPLLLLLLPLLELLDDEDEEEEELSFPFFLGDAGAAFVCFLPGELGAAAAFGLAAFGGDFAAASSPPPPPNMAMRAFFVSLSTLP